jgi:hypothetical protein
MLKSLFVLVALVIVGGIADARPFFCRRICQPPPAMTVAATASPIFTMQSPASKPEEAPVPQPWLLNSVTANISSQQPDTALEPVEGTGSKLPIGPKVPDKITHTLDAETLKKIEALLAGMSRKTEPVSIHLPITDETSQRSSRLLMVLEWLLYAVAGYFGLSKVGPFMQLVVRVASGLPSALKEASQGQAQVPPATSSTPTKG